MNYKKKNYSNEDAIYNLVHYVLTDKKTGGLVRYSACRGVLCEDIHDIVSSMKAVKKRYGKSDKVQMHHFILSFGEITDVKEVYKVGKKS
jgi:hypothetical protein